MFLRSLSRLQNIFETLFKLYLHNKYLWTLHTEHLVNLILTSALNFSQHLIHSTSLKESAKPGKSFYLNFPAFFLISTFLCLIQYSSRASTTHYCTEFVICLDTPSLYLCYFSLDLSLSYKHMLTKHYLRSNLVPSPKLQL